MRSTARESSNWFDNNPSFNPFHFSREGQPPSFHAPNTVLPNPVSDPDKASTPNFKFRRESDQPTSMNKRLDLDSHNLNNRFSNAHQD